MFALILETYGLNAKEWLYNHLERVDKPHMGIKKR
jgi:hypothetical protein